MTAIPPRAITRLVLRCSPLTPVHVGDGTEAGLEDYFLDQPTSSGRQYDEFGEEIETPPAGATGAHLCRFDPMAAMQVMTPAEQSAMRAALDRGKLADAAAALRKAGARAVMERIAITDAAARDLAAALAGSNQRAGTVRPFVRSSGAPYIPGSSLKGAFRTALVSALLQKRLDQTRPGSDEQHWTHDDAMNEALGIIKGDTATDPLRHLSISDAWLPPGSTIIDQPEVYTRKEVMGRARPGGNTSGIRIHLERTRSLVEGIPIPFDITVSIDDRAERWFDRTRLLANLRIFHVKLFVTERDHFFPAEKDALNAALRRHVAPDGRPPFTQAGWAPDFVIFRLGRFGHFESKSLEGIRRGHLPQAKDPRDRIRQANEWGATRTVVRQGDRRWPFGWVVGWVVAETKP
jgi:CRISPR-associated protein Csm5